MFDDFVKNGKVRKGEPDIALSKALVAMSSRQLSFVSSLPITSESASQILTNHYEALREICEAICARDGYKVYSHEAFTSYLKEKLNEEAISYTFDRLRRLRNGVNYYGENVSKEEAEAASKDVVAIINTLRKKHLKG